MIMNFPSTHSLNLQKSTAASPERRITLLIVLSLTDVNWKYRSFCKSFELLFSGIP